MTRQGLAACLRLLVVSALTAAILVVPVGNVSAKEGPSWSRGGSGWSGSGTVFLPGGTHHGSSNSSSDCPGCSWELIPICDLDGPKSCTVLHDCPVGKPFVAILLRSPATGAKFVGGQCLFGDPISSADLGRLIASRLRQEAPTAQPGFQPRTAALTSLPTIFRAGQPGVITRSESIAGIPVQFRATARWRWTWGDGSKSTATTKPGGTWPDMSLTHTFRRPGARSVTVRTLWDAEFTVDGDGPFAVEGGPIEQERTISVPVREARAVLIGADLG